MLYIYHFFIFLLSTAQSLIFDSIKHSIEPLPSGAVAMAPPNESATDEAGAPSDTAGMLPFQVQFIKNLIDESLDEFRYKKLSIRFTEYKSV